MKNGGVGKTTTTIQFSSGLTKKKFRVLSIDLDPQMNLSNTFGLKPSMNVYTIYDVLSDSVDIKKAIYKTSEGVFVLFGDDRMRNDSIFTEEYYYKLRDKLKEVSEIFDFCIIDTPPLTRNSNIMSLTASNEIIVTMNADTYSMQGLAQTLKVVDLVKKKTNPSIILKGILLTMYEGRTIFSKMTEKEIQEISNKFNVPIFKTTIRKSIKIKESQSQCQSIFAYEPKSKVAKDYEDFIFEYLKSEQIHPQKR